MFEREGVSVAVGPSHSSAMVVVGKRMLNRAAASRKETEGSMVVLVVNFVALTVVGLQREDVRGKSRRRSRVVSNPIPSSYRPRGGKRLSERCDFALVCYFALTALGGITTS